MISMAPITVILFMSQNPVIRISQKFNVESQSTVYTVSLSYMQVAIRALGFDVKKADVQKILRDCDKENTGKISLADFTEISTSL